MLIATKDFDIKSLASIIADPEKVVSVVEASVPIYLRHHREIVMNQRFYVAGTLRGSGMYPTNLKIPACEALVSGIFITGTPEIFVTIEDIKNDIDIELLKSLLEDDIDDNTGDISTGRGVYLTQNISV